MTTETSNGSTPPAEAPAPEAVTTEQQPIAEGDALEYVKAEKDGDGIATPYAIPTAAPPEGTEYVFDPASGLWKVRRIRTDAEIADSIAKAQSVRSEDDEEQPTASEAAGQAVAEQITVPTILPDSLQYDPASAETVKEVGAILGEVGYQPAAVQRVVDLAAEFFTEANERHPHLDDKEGVEAVLRNRWGSEHDANMKAVHAASKRLGPKFQEWLALGYGNHVAVIETLRALGSGDLSLGKEAATKEMEKIRASAAMKDRFHRDHKYAVTRYRVLANVAARGDDNGAGFEAAVSKALGDQVKKLSRGEVLPTRAAAAPTADPEARIKQLRTQYGKTQNGSPEQRALGEAIASEYRRLYPGEVEA